MEKDKRYAVTITRQFGSMGRPIAKKMAEILGVSYYDRDIVDQAAEKLQLPASDVDENEEKAVALRTNIYSRMAYPLGRQNTTAKQDKIFEAQKNIIQFLAEKESCIIVGRCADFALEDMPNVIRIFIYADYKCRLKHCVEDLHLSENDGKLMIREVDEARKAYHINYAGYAPGDIDHTDILINSSLLGIDKTAEYLAEAVKMKF
jgi:cytidylate kinase